MIIYWCLSEKEEGKGVGKGEEGKRKGSGRGAEGGGEGKWGRGGEGGQRERLVGYKGVESGVYSRLSG